MAQFCRHSSQARQRPFSLSLLTDRYAAVPTAGRIWHCTSSIRMSVLSVCLPRLGFCYLNRGVLTSSISSLRRLGRVPRVKQAVLEAVTICPRPAPCKLTFDLLTLKVVFESRVTWATSVPILGFPGLSVLDLGLMYATDRRQTSDVRRASSRNCPLR